MMEEERSKRSSLDYVTLQDLARSLNIRYVEAHGLDMRRGIRFKKDGTDWIAVDSSLPVVEKIRTLGYLLNNDPAGMAGKVGIKGDFSGSSPSTPVLTLCCS